MKSKRIPKRLSRNLHLLQILSKSKPGDQKSITPALNVDIIKCLSDCSRNILNGNIKVTPSEKKSLYKYRTVLRKLSNKKYTIPKRKKILINQKGGFLGFLIKPVLSVLGNLLNN